MKEGPPKQVHQIEKDNELLDFVNYQAQEAILSPVLSGEKKDQRLRDAIETINQVAERKAAYFAKHGAGRKTRTGIRMLRA